MSSPDLALLKLPLDSTWRRISHTPLRDLLRGRVTARWEVTRETAAVHLPPLAAQLVYTVAQRTRLWPQEKLDVARELAGHFRDGLDAGQTAEQLVEDFGNLRQAVKLIRRARLRCRPLWWQVLRGAAWAVLLLALIPVVWFLWHAVLFWMGRPTISRNFAAEMNAPALAVPQDERAWPYYRDAALALQPQLPADAELLDLLQNDCEPGSETWQKMLDYLQRQSEPLRLVREGAARPRFGFVFGDLADRQFMQQKVQRDSILPQPDECLIQTLLPHLQEMRGLARLLDLDARRAVEAGDAATLRSDLRAMLALANHVWDADSFMIGDLISLACFNLAMESVGHALAERPELLTEVDLRDLSHQIAAVAGGGDIRLRLASERNVLLDVIQRMYTDDGSGDGHLTAEGHKFLLAYMPLVSLDGKSHPVPWYQQQLLGPAACGLIAGRAEMTEVAMRLFDQVEVEQRGPLYQWKPSEVEAEIKQMAGSVRQKIRYMPIMLLFPAAQAARRSGELSCQRREGTVAALALELFHRRSGEWPKTLAELSPGLMPTPPLDRFTGQPLGYAIVDDRPLLYSRGADGQDDGGTPPPGANRADANQQAGLLGNSHSGKPALSGYDWVLWPPAPLPPAPVDAP